MIDDGTAEQIAREKITLARSRNRIFDLVFPPISSRQIEPFFRWLPIPEGLTSEEPEVLTFFYFMLFFTFYFFFLPPAISTALI